MYNLHGLPGVESGCLTARFTLKKPEKLGERELGTWTKCAGNQFQQQPAPRV